MQQTVVQDVKSLRLGSCLLEVGDDPGSLLNLGMVEGAGFEETFDSVWLDSDNAGRVFLGIRNQKCAATGNLQEVKLETMNTLRGGIDSYTTQAAAPVSVTNEPVVLKGTAFSRLANRSNAGAEVTAITVTNIAGTTTYARNTDYVMAVDAQGYTCIARIAGGTITDKQTVHVDYTYAAAASKTLKSGGKVTVTPKIVRLTNTNTAGKIFRITIYKASNEAGIKLEFPGDQDPELWSTPINLVGTTDPTRTEGEQLFEIYDEQTA